MSADFTAVQYACQYEIPKMLNESRTVPKPPKRRHFGK
jgi:hypothetical protein